MKYFQWTKSQTKISNYFTYSVSIFLIPFPVISFPLLFSHFTYILLSPFVPSLPPQFILFWLVSKSYILLVYFFTETNNRIPHFCSWVILAFNKIVCMFQFSSFTVKVCHVPTQVTLGLLVTGCVAWFLSTAAVILLLDLK